jgi:hypothetical protein
MMKSCPNCGQTFEGSTRQRFCRDQCRRSYSRREYERKHPEKRREREIAQIIGKRESK